MFLTILVFVVMLSVLVLIHELGHFLVAKKFGIKVEEFGFGFPPRVWGKKIGETLYSINALPIGGFVKLYGEDEAGGGQLKVESIKLKVKDFDRTFFARPVSQRILVVIAGVVMNFLLAIIIATYLFTFQGIPANTNKVEVSEVLKNSPADLAGLKSGDLIEKVGNVSVATTAQLVSETKKHLDEQINITLNRSGNIEIIKVTPRKNYPPNQGPMGVAVQQQVNFQKYPFPQSIFYAVRQVGSDSVRVLFGFTQVIKDTFRNFSVPQGVAGPIGMAQLTGEFVKIGPSAVLSLVYMLTLSLAVLNILPIPALDGGRLFFILVEAVTRRRVNARFEAIAHMVGIVVLLTFIAVVSFQDVSRIFSGQSILPQ